MKKLLLILIMILVCSSSVISSNVLKIYTAPTTSGDTGKFTVVMKNDISVNGLNFTLQYEPNLITPIKIISVDRAGLLSGSTAALFNEDKINFLVYDQGYSLLASDSGVIFEVSYIVKDFLSDSTKAHIVFTEAMVADSSIKILPFEFINGEISLSPSVGVKETQNSLPSEFRLYQNYPNPFNPTTTIQFDIPKTSFVSLKIYNLLGQEVATLVNEEKQVGKYEVKFDKSNLASGVYLYQLKAVDNSTNSGQSFIQTKKMLYLK